MTKTKEILDVAILSISFIFVQSALFVLFYVYNILLPFWLLWFPVIIYGGIAVIMIFTAIMP